MIIRLYPDGNNLYHSMLEYFRVLLKTFAFACDSVLHYVLRLDKIRITYVYIVVRTSREPLQRLQRVPCLYHFVVCRLRSREIPTLV